MNQTQPGSVSAVVVAFNGGPALQECVASLLAQTIPIEVIVVDNASTDGSVGELEREYGSSVRIERRERNGGYAAGANTGWRSATSDLVAILNQDLKLMPDCLERLRDVLVGSETEALVTPKLVLKSDPTRVNAIGNEVNLSGIAWCSGLETQADDWHGVRHVTAISGAAFMARRSFLAQLDGLEEAYFMYMEDVDLSLRARLAGAICIAACDAVAIHDWRSTLSPRKFGLLERNRMAFWRRLWAADMPRMLLPLAQAETMAWVYALLQGPPYIRVKWQAARAPLVLPTPSGSIEAIRRILSTRHPYEQLFPRRRSIQSLGRRIDQLLTRLVSP